VIRKKLIPDPGIKKQRSRISDPDPPSANSDPHGRFMPNPDSDPEMYDQKREQIDSEKTMHGIACSLANIQPPKLLCFYLFGSRVRIHNPTIKLECSVADPDPVPF
jgi:hypothetical protein